MGARVLIAARLSRSDTEASRIERDDEKARQWAESNHRAVVGTAPDRNVSGSTDPFKRPALGPWLDPKGSLIQTYDEIVVSKLDRLARSARHLHKLQEWADEHGKRITIREPTEMHYPFEKGDIASKILWELLGILAEWELETITERHAAARSKVRENGGYIGKPPFGFEVVGPKYNRTIQPIPELVPVIRELIRYALRGDTLLSMAQWLDSQGIPPRMHGKQMGSQTIDKWSPMSVKNLLTSPALKGRQITKDGRITHKHQGIIEASEWEELQRAMDRGKKRSGRKRNGEDTALLTGIVYCERCGGPMYRVRSSTTRKDGSRNTIAYYRCKGPDNAPSKCRNMINLDLVDGLVHASFMTFTVAEMPGMPPELGDRFSGMFAGLEVVEQVVIAGNDHAAEIAEIAAEIDHLDKDAPDYLEHVVRLTEKRKRLQGLPLEDPQVIERPTGRTVGELWLELDDSARRRYLLAAGFKVLVDPGKGARMVGNPERIMGALRTIAA